MWGILGARSKGGHADSSALNHHSTELRLRLRRSSPQILVYLLVIGGIHVLIALGLFVWGRWVARRQGGALWRRLAWLLFVVSLVTSVVGSVKRPPAGR
jgi:membrane-associated PAP2 superfamily phosphatase